MKKKLISTLTGLVLSGVASAATLTIGDCVSKARANYPSIARYGLVEKLSQLELSNIAKAWLPHGSIGAQVTWQNDVTALPDALTHVITQQGISYPGMDKTQYRIGIDVSQQIWDGGRVNASRKIARAGADSERSSLDATLFDVEGHVEEIYFSALLLEAHIKRTEKSMALIDSTLTRVRAMYADGVAMRSDCEQIEARLLELCRKKSELQASAESIYRILEIFIGEPIGGRNLELPEEKQTADPAADHPHLRNFDAMIRTISAREYGVRASSMPSLGAFAQGYYGYPGYNIFKNMQSRDLSFNFMAGLKATWNFGTLYTRNNTLSRIKLQKEEIENNKAVFLFNNEIAQNEEQGRIDALREMMESDEKILALRQSVMAAAEARLENGVIDTMGLLTKITDAELAEIDLIQHRIELTKAIYHLKHLKNQ